MEQQNSPIQKCILQNEWIFRTHEVWLNYIASKKENGTLYTPLPAVLVSDLERCLESDGTLQVDLAVYTQHLLGGGVASATPPLHPTTSEWTVDSGQAEATVRVGFCIVAPTCLRTSKYIFLQI